ncbi:MAG: transglycosylase SLT domain-containing protein [Tannerellaceae bacterium]|jgi:membrane-bound lytic murein transglycosylase F|nr:transglycosylase SLT domain-containing protein [Tannerellaceae bacterium]
MNNTPHPGRLFRLLLLCVLCPALLGSCRTKPGAQTETTDMDFPQLKEKGEITAVTLYSSTSYFLYRMEPMGYEYELIRDFAQMHNLKLTVKVAESQARLIEMLQAGEADVAAYPILFSQELKQQLIYCGRESLSSQALVQSLGPGVKRLTDVTGLIGKEIYVKSGSRYHDRLQNLDRELGGGILIHEVDDDDVSEEDLIEMVSTGQIPYTVSDEKVALLNKTYYWNIDVSLKISFRQRSSWAVRKNAPLLAEAINQWASGQESDQSYKATAKRYFELSKKILEQSTPAIRQGQISPYDSLFRKYARKLEWDWRLLASLAYQESHFKNTEISWAGAQGLMGIMPGTARTLRIPLQDLADPEVSIRAGVEVLYIFRQGLNEITDATELIKFTLAAYNAGIGHIYDARRLAGKYGKDSTVWDDHVAEFVLLKSEPAYYNDPVCRYGYLRGRETFYYVREILGRYEYYCQQTLASQ